MYVQNTFKKFTDNTRHKNCITNAPKHHFLLYVQKIENITLLLLVQKYCTWKYQHTIFGYMRIKVPKIGHTNYKEIYNKDAPKYHIRVFM